MQAVESETLILYHTDLSGQWPEEAARALAERLPYGRRLSLGAARAGARASLAGIALALRALTRVLGREVGPGELVFAADEKPRLRTDHPVAADFSITHAGCWVACAALARGQVGLDLEMGSTTRIADWVRREALLKARGLGVRQLRELPALGAEVPVVEWGGERWHLRPLAEFRGAVACVASNLRLGDVESRHIALGELLAS
jgi:hypothetical protein